MLAAIVLLLLIGLLLLVIEALVPGGIIGTLGAAAIIASAVLCYSEYGPVAGTAYLVGSLVLAVTVGVSAFLFAARRLALRPPEPAKPDNAPGDRLGAKGVVVKRLGPTGMVEIGGKRYQARTESSEQAIEVGQEALVCAIDSTFLVVRAC